VPPVGYNATIRTFINQDLLKFDVCALRIFIGSVTQMWASRKVKHGVLAASAQVFAADDTGEGWDDIDE
jgi:hypothetical protein